MADNNFIQTWVAPLIVGLFLIAVGLVVSNTNKQPTQNHTVVVLDTVKLPVSIPDVHPKPEDITANTPNNNGPKTDGIEIEQPIVKNNPCEGKQTGNILLKNNTDKVLYLYYNTPNNEFRFVDPLTIKPFDNELLYDLPVGQIQEYKVVSIKPANRTSMHYIQGETGGHFSPDPCNTRQFVLDL